MSIIFRNGKYYDSTQESIPEETQTIEPQEKLSFMDKYGTKYKSKFNLSDYLKQISETEQVILEKKKKLQDPYEYSTYTTNATNAYTYSIYDAKGISTLITPTGGIWNELIKYEHKKIAEKENYSELAYQQYLKMIGTK